MDREPLPSPRRDLPRRCRAFVGGPRPHRSLGCLDRGRAGDLRLRLRRAWGRRGPQLLQNDATVTVNLPQAQQETGARLKEKKPIIGGVRSLPRTSGKRF